MDYKEKYKQALERAKAYHNDYTKDIIEEIFPELKGSEDERHRKWILEYLYDGLRKSDEQFKDQFKCAISWLKKQGEKPQGKSALEAIHEQKKVQASLPSFDEQQGTPVVDIEIPFGAKDSELQEASYHIPEGFHAEIQGDKVVIKKGKNPSWSEADKDFMYNTLSNLTELKDRYGEGYGNVGKCIDWLKSLKQRYTWKPSDNELEVLRLIAEKDGTCLMGLYEQLKKL